MHNSTSYVSIVRWAEARPGVIGSPVFNSVRGSGLTYLAVYWSVLLILLSCFL